MANRDAGARVGTGTEALVRALIRRIERLESQVRDLQARGPQLLPPDFRFEREAVTGGYAVVIRRVSTDATEEITGPL